MGIVRARNGSGVFVADEGPALATDARLGATLDAFARAAEAALSAGHDREELERILRERNGHE
jgi:hypothetical protein